MSFDSGSYKNLIVWEKSMVLVEEIYKLTNDFPEYEKFGIISQMRRCAVSIPSNIAEGSKRGTLKDFNNFLYNAFGSGAELETQLEISSRLKYINQEQFSGIENLLTEIMKMLNKMISNFKRKASLAKN
ncbi:MAG: four helix bundle protein [Patescibacteria group bacterium]|jgi:four helix bundle protein|nr:four helix bundle protein [Patescibacteria group bacterium]